MRNRRLRLFHAAIPLALGAMGACATPALAAQQEAAMRYSCYLGLPEDATPSGATVHVNEFTIELKPDPNPDEMQCHATVRSPTGDVVFQYDDWDVSVDPITGKDINGDGQPDAVLVGFSGGAHCCWTYSFISLGEKPGPIRAFGDQLRVTFKDLKGDGRIEILVPDGTFDEFEGLQHPVSPIPLLILRLEGNKFKDVGSEFLNMYDERIRNYHKGIEAASLDKFIHSNPAEDHDSLDYVTTESGVLLIVLDYLYSGRPKDAWKALDELWPAADRERIRNEILRGYCHGLRADLGLGASPPCKSDDRSAAELPGATTLYWRRRIVS